MPENEASPSRKASVTVPRWAIAVPLVVGGALLLWGSLPWLSLVTPRWFVLRVAIIFLWCLLGAFATGMPVALVATVWSWLNLTRARRRRDRAARARAMRWVLLASSCLVSLIVMELVARFTVEWSYRIPKPQVQFAESPDRPRAEREVARSRSP